MRRTIMAVAMAALPSVTSLWIEPIRAATAPKFDRTRQLAEALKHLNEIAHMLKEPIDRIEYSNGGEVQFIAGKCTVPVTVQGKLLTQREAESGAPLEYMSEVGAIRCAP